MSCTIEYDASGNPTTYYNGTEWDMVWSEGRRLVSASDGTTSLDFTYDSNGLRLSKTVNDSTTYNYYYAGGKLMRQTGGGNTLDFFYDANGNPYALKYNNTLYYYITNLQGDVLKIVNTSGTPVVSYSYDPYGKPADPTGDLATTVGEHNPLRYRGYLYDTETGLYYLQSRYYDPSTCRFINADAYASTGQGVLGNNMFVYCLNNPINFLDTTGEIAVTTLILIASIVVGVASGGYTAYKTHKAGWDIGDILWYTFGATLSGFLTIYTLGMSAYQLYTQYCMLNGITPVTEIQFSNATSSGSANNAPASTTVPNAAYETKDYVETHNGTPPSGYKGGKVFENYNQTLPSSGAPYHEYDIYPKMEGVSRGAERIVRGSDGVWWYTKDHYVSFVRME